MWFSLLSFIYIFSCYFRYACPICECVLCFFLSHCPRILVFFSFPLSVTLTHCTGCYTTIFVCPFFCCVSGCAFLLVANSKKCFFCLFICFWYSSVVVCRTHSHTLNYAQIFWYFIQCIECLALSFFVCLFRIHHSGWLLFRFLLSRDFYCPGCFHLPFMVTHKYFNLLYFQCGWYVLCVSEATLLYCHYYIGRSECGCCCFFLVLFRCGCFCINNRKFYILFGYFQCVIFSISSPSYQF